MPFMKIYPFEFGWWSVQRTLEKAQRAKEDMGFEYATQNVEDLFDDDNIQIINICTPNNLHRDHVIGALKAGKHVYCDKPWPPTMMKLKKY